MNTLKTIVTSAIIAFVTALSLGHAPQTNNVGSTVPIAPSVFETYLASQIATSDTSMVLAATALRDGTTLAGYVCFTVDSNTSVLEYICGTATAGSQTITGLLRGVDPISGTSTVASLTFAHRRGADVKITDYPILSILGRMANGNDTYPNALSYGSQVSLGSASSTSTQVPYVSWVFNNFADLYSNQTVGGIKTFTGKDVFNTPPTSATNPSANSDVANKQYVDGVAVSGAPNANATTKGIVQEATIAQINSFTDTGSTGAKLFFTPQDFQNSNLASTTITVATSTTDYKLVTLSANQKLLIWGVSTAGGLTATLQYRFSTDLSTTTLMQVAGNGGGTNQQTIPTFGLVKATSTSATVAIGLSGGVPDYIMTLITN